MRRLLLPILLLGALSTVIADDHFDHLRVILAKASKHGVPVPQPSTIQPNATARVFNITATASPWQFTISPMPFAVDEGDAVTLNVSVPAGDPSPSGHSIFMDTYIDSTVNVNKGQTRQIQFTATTAGTFAYICMQSNCGNGHSSMFGQLVVNAVAPALTVTNVSPVSGPAVGGTTITITGSGFASGATVAVGGTAATNVVVVSSTTITARTPAHAAGTVDVVVTMGGTSAQKSAAFTYLPVDPPPPPTPTISTVLPSYGRTAGGTPITITGSGFVTGVTVTVGGVPALNVVIVNGTTITALTSPHAAAVVDVEVGNSGIVARKVGAFTYTDTARKRSVRH